MKVIYLASPYTLGDQASNVREHMRIANDLMMHGFAVICPLLFHFMHISHPHPKSFWLQQDFALLEKADIFVRSVSHTPSEGADEEEALAERLGLPIYTFDSFLSYYDMLSALRSIA